jgi:putative oxidoreductase
MTPDASLHRTSPTAATRSACWSDWAPVVIRIVIGIGFVMHGYAKWSRGPAGFGNVLHTLGVPFPVLLAWMTTLVELAGGAAILAGAWVRVVSIPLGIVLLTAFATVHVQYGFFSVKLVEVTSSGIKFGTVGYELVLLYLGGLGAIALGGAGPLSVDRWLARVRLRA